MRARPALILAVAAALCGCLSASHGAADPGTDTATDTATPGDPGTTPDEGGATDVTTTADAPVTCVEALACVERSGTFSPAYAAPCVEGADTATKLQMQAILDCAQSKCGSFGATQVLQFGACVFDQCRDLVEPCSRAGTKACLATMQCAAACGMQMTCALGCEDVATYDARVAFARVAACLEAKCPGALLDSGAAMTCVTSGPCAATMAGCS